jgi:hypothetical protein
VTDQSQFEHGGNGSDSKLEHWEQSSRHRERLISGLGLAKSS